MNTGMPGDGGQKKRVRHFAISRNFATLDTTSNTSCSGGGDGGGGGETLLSPMTRGAHVETRQSDGRAGVMLQ